MAESTEFPTKGTKPIPMQWHVPDGLPVNYANHLTVQFDGSVFYVSFFHMVPPHIMGSPEERESQLEKLESVKAECVTRVIVPKDRMPSFVKAMQQSMERSQKLLDELSEEVDRA